MEKDTIEIVSISEPDDDGMLTIDLLFHDESVLTTLEDLAKKRGISLSQIFAEALLEHAKRVGNMTPAEVEKLKESIKDL